MRHYKEFPKRKFGKQAVCEQLLRQVKNSLRAVSHFSCESQWIESTRERRAAKAARMCIILLFRSPRVALRKEGRPLGI